MERILKNLVDGLSVFFKNENYCEECSEDFLCEENKKPFRTLFPDDD